MQLNQLTVVIDMQPNQSAAIQVVARQGRQMRGSTVQAAQVARRQALGERVALHRPVRVEVEYAQGSRGREEMTVAGSRVWQPARLRYTREAEQTASECASVHSATVVQRRRTSDWRCGVTSDRSAHPTSDSWPAAAAAAATAGEGSKSCTSSCAGCSAPSGEVEQTRAEGSGAGSG